MAEKKERPVGKPTGTANDAKTVVPSVGTAPTAPNYEETANMSKPTMVGTAPTAPNYEETANMSKPTMVGTAPTGPVQTANVDERITNPNDISAAWKTRNAYDAANDDYQQSLYDFNKYLTDAITAEPMLSAEDRAKRERAAAAIGGFSSLGNIANAFSNLIWTGQGAPSQTLPEAPDFGKGIQELRDDERAKAQNFIGMAKQRLDAQRARVDMLNQQKQQEFVNKMTEREHDLKTQKAQIEIGNLVAQGEYAKAHALAEQYRAQGLAVEAQMKPALMQSNIDKNNTASVANQARAAASYASAANSGAARVLNQRKGVKTILLDDNTTIDIPVSAYNTQALAKIAKAAGISTKTSKDTYSSTGRKTGSVEQDMTADQLAEALGNAASSGNETQRIIIERGLKALNGQAPRGTVSGKTTPSSKEEKKGASNSSNTMPGVKS